MLGLGVIRGGLLTICGSSVGAYSRGVNSRIYGKNRKVALPQLVYEIAFLQIENPHHPSYLFERHHLVIKIDTFHT